MRKNLYYFLVGGTALMLVCIFVFAKEPKQQLPPLKERKQTIALSAEWLNTKTAINSLLAELEQNPANVKVMIQLAQAYIQEGRVTGDHAYYDKAALELLDNALKKEPMNFEGLCCKATVLLSQHHFAEGKQVAEQAMKLQPSSAFVYGLMCDACVELGDYEKAVKMGDKMVSLRPDIRSYARISYLREIHGDLPGAIQAARLAVDAGYPGLEQTEWTRCVLGHLYEISGQNDSARYQYRVALAERPNYAYAYAGLGSIEKANGNYTEAIKYYEKAKTCIVDYSFADELTDLYRLNGQKDLAEKNSNEVISMLSPGTDVEDENGHGHYADKELAYAYLKINNYNKALACAVKEFNKRPHNIEACELMGWVKYKQGDFFEANILMDKALRTGSKNPELLCKAGLVKIKAGQPEKGIALVKLALETNPLLDAELRSEGNRLIAVK